jgi:hypothetical protein
MGLKMTKGAAPSTPATNKAEIFIDTNYRACTIDDKGVISVLNHNGLDERNIIVNGGFSIQQKVAVASTAITGISTTTRGGVVADAWSVTSSVASNLNWQQVDTGSAPETGLDSRYYGSIIAASAGKKVMISQWILNEDMRHLLGKKVRVSIKHNMKVGTSKTFKLGLLQLTSAGTIDTSPAFLSGAWSVTTGVDPAWNTNLAAITPDASPTGENGTITGAYLNVSTVGNTWVKSSAVFTVPTNAKNLVMVFFADATGGTTDNVSIAEAQITLGAEVVDYIEPSFTDNLLRCQRRFCKSFPLTTVPAQGIAVATAGNGATGIIGKAGATALASFINIQFPTRLFKVPTTVTLFSPVAAGAVPYRITGTTPAVQTTVAQTGVMDYGLVVSATGDANGAVGDLVGIHYTASAEIVA